MWHFYFPPLLLSFHVEVCVHSLVRNVVHDLIHLHFLAWWDGIIEPCEVFIELLNSHTVRNIHGVGSQNYLLLVIWPPEI